MANAQTDILTIVAGERRLFGPRYVWNSTGVRQNCSTLHAKFIVRDYAGGTLLGTLSTNASTSLGLLKFSAAVSGRYYVLMKGPLTSAYGGVDCWFQLQTSAALAGAPIVWQRGKLQIKQTL